VAEAHKEQKILVGLPSDEVVRICPEDGRVLGAGAVLRLGGAHLGGYGESDIAYAYRQLSRALHPDKNPDLDKAPAAFHRLSEASEELRQGLDAQRAALQQLVAAMGGTATPQMLERPQEALFAEATRMLCAVCGIVGEGEVSAVAQGRAFLSFSRSSKMFYSCQIKTLLTEWFEKTQLLDLYASVPVRTAYDCAPKRYRGQFLCLLNRAVIAEAKRFNDCVRGSWPTIMQTFPELGLWRDLRQAIQSRVWDSSGEPAPPVPDEPVPEPEPEKKSRSRKRSRSRRRRDRSSRGDRKRNSHKEADDKEYDGRSHRDSTNDWYDRDRTKGRKGPPIAERERIRDDTWDSRWTTSDGGEQHSARKEEEPVFISRENREVIAVHPTMGWRACRWARKWRAAMAAILPSGFDSALPVTDHEVRKLAAMLWKDIINWSKGTDVERVLGLYKCDHQTSKTFGWDAKAEAAASRGLEPGLPPAEWCFIPAADLLLVVGEGLVGITTEGLFADKPKGQKRQKLEQCYKKRDTKDEVKTDGSAPASKAESERSSKWDK
ncbi:unnamed protein product, partial [Polarella glacialis]